MQNGRGVCSGFGSRNNATAWLEQNRNAMRQLSFARARCSMKRKFSDDEEDTGDVRNASQLDPAKLYVLDRLKRIRVSSPPLEHQHQFDTKRSPTSPTAMDEVPEVEMTTEDQATDEKAVVLVSKPVKRIAKSRAWGYHMPNATAVYGTHLRNDTPSDPTCTALVVFDPKKAMGDPHNSRPLSSAPIVELVESDEDNAFESSSSDSDQESFRRFEELDDDGDVEMDID